MAKKVETPEAEFLNPFTEGVSYDQFLATVPEGTSVKEHCDLFLDADQIIWLESELEFHRLNQLPAEAVVDENQI